MIRSCGVLILRLNLLLLLLLLLRRLKIVQ